jgi:segregation and condensation protein B
MKQLATQINSLLFLNPNGLDKTELVAKLNTTDEELTMALVELAKHLSGSGIELLNDNDKLQLAATSNNLPKDLQAELSQEQLSPAVLEVLTIIAYHQPITQFDIEQMRGVGSDQSLKSLLERELIKSSSKKVDGISLAHYITTNAFLAHMGIKSINELPPLNLEEKDSATK